MFAYYSKHLNLLAIIGIFIFSINAQSGINIKPGSGMPHEELFKLISQYSSYSMNESEILNQIENLVKKGANPNAHVRTIVYTKKIGANIFNYKNKHWSNYTYSTPFHAAVSKKSIPLVEKLIELGANPDTPDKQLTYPIQLALKKNDTAMIFYLLKHRVSIKRVYLTEEMEFLTLKKLLEMGADPNKTAKNRKPPIEYLLRNGDSKKVLMLLKYGVNIKTINLKDCDNLNLIEKLVKMGADPRNINVNMAFEGDEELNRLLALKPDLKEAKLSFHDAFKKTDILYKLLDNGLDIGAKDRMTNYPLIFGAVKYGKVTDVENLVKRGASLNAKFKSENLLEYAIRNKRADMVTFMLNKRVNSGSTSPLLVLAAKSKNVVVLEYLIKAGQKVDSKTRSGETALIIAVKEGDLSSVEVITEHGAKVNHKTTKGKTALIEAIELSEHFNKDKFGIIKQLVEKGANIKDYYLGKSLIEYAISKKCSYEIINYLKNPDPGTIPLLNYKGDFSKYDLSRIKDVREIERYVRWGASPNSININFALDDTVKLKRLLKLHPVIKSDELDYDKVSKYGTLPVILRYGDSFSTKNNKYYKFGPLMKSAINQNDTVSIKLLIEKGYDINGFNTLDRSIRKKNLLLSEYLIRNGANINKYNTIGNTPLMEAIKQQEYEIAELLLQKGAEPYLLCENKSSPLTFAIKKREHIKALMLFFEYGISVNYKDSKSKLLIEYAVEFENEPALQLLIDNNVDLANNEVHTPLHKAFLSNNEVIIELLIKAGAKLNQQFSNKGRLLAKAIKEERRNAAKALVNYGADVNFKPREGTSPLFTAIKNKDLELIKLLIDKGASTNLRYNFRKPYDYAQLIRCPKEILDYLKQYD